MRHNIQKHIEVMKKYVVLFLLMIAGAMGADAQVYEYQAKQFAFKRIVNGSWTDWTDWQPSTVRVRINYNTDVITVYSSKTQVYRVVEHLRNYTDSSGGKQVEFKIIDQDDDIGHVRLRIETNGNSQMYVDYKNLILCYSGLQKLQ